MATASGDSSMAKQFAEIRSQLSSSVRIKERIRTVVMEMEATNRLLHSSLTFIHHSPNPSEVQENTGVHVETLKKQLRELADILRDCPGEYYRYHGDWKNEVQFAVSSLCFLHWLDTGKLLTHTEAEERLGLNPQDFGLDVEDYLIGVCLMSNELPRYVVNQVTSGDYNCPGKVLEFLTDLSVAFRMLNLRNDFLRRKFDGMKYDLRRVTEVHSDVKIRGLLPSEDIANGQEVQI
ncbi:hypothetical protein Droror1_Dr00016827 [Drosera rotundifolia]